MSHLILDRNFPGLSGASRGIEPPQQVLDLLRNRPELRPESGRIALLPYSDKEMPASALGLLPEDTDPQTGWLIVHDTTKGTDLNTLVTIIQGSTQP